MAQKKYGIDLGTSAIVIASPENGVLLQMPSVVAVDRRTDAIIAMGEEALGMLGRVPPYISVVRPLRGGVIREHLLTAELIRYGLGQVSAGAKPIVAVCAPTALSGVERDAAVSAVVQAGAGRVLLLEEPLAAALGSGTEVTGPEGTMIVDVGGGTTDVTVLSMGGQVCTVSVSAAGDALDEEMVRHMRVRHGLAIGPCTAEEMKIRIACARKNGFSENMDVKGRSLNTGLPQRIIMNTAELYDAVGTVTAQIAAAARQVLERTPPELAGDVYARGICLTGGGSRLQGLDEYLAEALKMEVHRAPDPLNSVALGAARSLTMAQKLPGGLVDVTARAFRLEN